MGLKVQNLGGGAQTLTNEFFYEYLLSINATPLHADFFKGSSAGHNNSRGILYSEETASVFWWPDSQMDVVLHRGSRLVVGSIRDGIRIVWGWKHFRSSA